MYYRIEEQQTNKKDRHCGSILGKLMTKKCFYLPDTFPSVYLTKHKHVFNILKKCQKYSNVWIKELFVDNKTHTLCTVLVASKITQQKESQRFSLLIQIKEIN